MRIRSTIFVSAALLAAGNLAAPAAEVDFYRDVYPILKTSCISCHNKTTTRSGLNLETPELIRRGGDSGPGVVPGKSGESLILQAAAHKGDYVMPPKDNKAGAPNLSPADLAVLTAWIDQGAKDSVMQVRPLDWQAVPKGVHPIYAVAMTADGRFAACGRANQLALYDLNTRRSIGPLIDNTLGKAGTSSAHRGMVYSLAFSPDGQRLASGSYREVKIWRRVDHPVQMQVFSGDGKILASDMTADGKFIASLDEKSVLSLRGASSKDPHKTISNVGHADRPLLAVSPDASKAAILRADGSIAIWSLHEGKLLTATPRQGEVFVLRWTRDGRSLLSGGADQIIRVWTFPEQPPAELPAPRELKGCAGAITGLFNVDDGDRCLSASRDGKLRLWSIAQNKALNELAIPAAEIVALSPDGKQFAAVGKDGMIRVWNTETGKEIKQLSGSLAFQQQLDAAQWRVSLAELDLSFRKQEVSRLESHLKTQQEVLKKAEETINKERKILPDEQKKLEQAKTARATADMELATVKSEIEKNSADKSLQARLKDAEKKRDLAVMAEDAARSDVQQIENHISDAQGQVTNATAAIKKNDQELPAANAAVTGAQKILNESNTALAAEKQRISKAEFRSAAIAFSADGQSLAALSEAGEFRLWAMATGLPIDQTALPKAISMASLVSPRPGTFIASGNGIAATFETSVTWKLERVLGAEPVDSPFADRVNAVRFSPDGQLLAAGSGEPSRTGDISLWNVANGQLVQNWRECHRDSVLSLDFSPDGNILASGAADRIARLWEIPSGRQLSFFEGHTHHVMGVSFRADGRELATAGADETVVIWSMLTQERQKKIEGWRKEVTSIQFLGATNQILTSGGDRLVRIVRDDGGQVRSMANLPEYMHAAAGDASGSLLMGGGEDGVLRIWDGKNGQELIQFSE